MRWESYNVWSLSWFICNWLLFYQATCLVAVHVRHLEVHYDYIVKWSRCFFNCLNSVCCLGDQFRWNTYRLGDDMDEHHHLHNIVIHNKHFDAPHLRLNLCLDQLYILWPALAETRSFLIDLQITSFISIWRWLSYPFISFGRRGFFLEAKFTRSIVKELWNILIRYIDISFVQILFRELLSAAFDTWR